MSRKTTGIEDLTNTLIKQHGIHVAIRAVHNNLGKSLDEAQRNMWLCVLSKLRYIRSLTY